VATVIAESREPPTYKRKLRTMVGITDPRSGVVENRQFVKRRMPKAVVFGRMRLNSRADKSMSGAARQIGKTRESNGVKAAPLVVTRARLDFRREEKSVKGIVFDANLR
jgi:hypothetical protein